ncbi:hypothetical protein [Enterococcus xiangfangensis]|uniref:hypothetical protein n=1 Tax=Enterococcus xiangfangensis TaxID=1296537 RepID=UPI003D16C85A|nr:hypothetical protein [Enterococcus asini]
MKKFFIICLAAAFLLVGCSRTTSQNSDKKTSSDSVTISSTRSNTIVSSNPQSSISSQSNTEIVSSNTSAATEQQQDFVSSSEFGGYATFYFDGMNVPESININTNTNQITFNSGTDQEAVYSLTMQNISAKMIRIFSANTTDIRKVKVSTALSIGSQISGAINSNNQSGDLYLFHNRDGGLSLATPNYAGNVPADQTDVMIEVIQ